MIYLVILNYALLASTFTIGKIALMYSKPCFLIGFRMILAGLLLLGYIVIKERSLVIRKDDIFLFMKVALTHVYFAFIPEFWALQFVSSAKTTVIYSVTPFIAALLSYFLYKERLGLKKIIALFIGMASLIPILMTDESLELLTYQVFSISGAELVLLVAASSGCYAWFVVKRLVARGYSMMFINGIAMLTGGILSMITSSVVEGIYPIPVTSWRYFLLGVIGLVLVSNIFFYNVYGFLLKHYSITFLSFAGFLLPVFGSLYGWYFLGEQITWHYCASLVLIVLGLGLFYKEEIQNSLGENTS